MIPNSWNVGKLIACANSMYQALFSDFSNGPGDEAKIIAPTLLSMIVYVGHTVLSML